jgi:hypothetical protein
LAIIGAWKLLTGRSVSNFIVVENVAAVNPEFLESILAKGQLVKVMFSFAVLEYVENVG